MAIIRLTPEAAAHQAANPTFVPKRLVDRNGNVVKIQTGWSHKGVNSQSTAERDNMAVNHLMAHGSSFVAKWNQEFGNTTVRFCGVEYTETIGGWSDTEGGSFPDFVSTYKAGGTAQGYPLVV